MHMDATDVTTLVTTGFAGLTTIILVIIGAAFTLVGMIVGGKAGIGWLSRIGKK